ncbi:Zinc finger CCHC domain-containing protein 8 [Smittium culicis]|uniref:Zinc finger CCHC domain-containing protein 8 n=1 Tax=Smittium culicis TaxID=133412 RepID=A0A1R1XRC9_9FUNG|nr:Zinc finger CCHC domain-containing protein 8 [Smittium culicis]
MISTTKSSFNNDYESDTSQAVILGNTPHVSKNHISYSLQFGVALGDVSNTNNAIALKSCFNCGSVYHEATNCYFPRNPTLYALNSAKYRASGQQQTNLRFHEAVELVNQELEMKKLAVPGVFSESLKDALGIKYTDEKSLNCIDGMEPSNKTVKFIENMYIYGYPPSYICDNKDASLEEILAAEIEDYSDMEVLKIYDSDSIDYDCETVEKQISTKNENFNKKKNHEFIEKTEYFPLVEFPGLDLTKFDFNEEKSSFNSKYFGYRPGMPKNTQHCQENPSTMSRVISNNMYLDGSKFIPYENQSDFNYQASNNIGGNQMQIYGDSTNMSYGYSSNHPPSNIFNPNANYQGYQEFYDFNPEYQNGNNYSSFSYTPQTFQNLQENFNQDEIGLDQNNDYKEVSKNETENLKATHIRYKDPNNVIIEPTSSEKRSSAYTDIYLSRNEDIISLDKDNFGYGYDGEVADKVATFKGTSKNFENKEIPKHLISFESLVSKNAEIEYERSLNSSSSGNSYKKNKAGFNIEKIGSEEGEVIDEDDDDDDSMHFSD